MNSTTTAATALHSFLGRIDANGEDAVFLQLATRRIQLVGPLIGALVVEPAKSWRIEGRYVDDSTVEAIKAVPLS